MQSLARPPPPQPPSRNQPKPKPKGLVKLSNRFAYGYGHVTLFSPPVQQAVGLLGGESEEVARIECHTFPSEANGAFEHTLRRILQRKTSGADTSEHEESPQDDQENLQASRTPSVAILLSWKEPWTFLDRLRAWFQLFARSLHPEGQTSRVAAPLDVLKESGLRVTVITQHVEAQEALERENYDEESFDYISQCLRTCILPLAAGLVYTSSAPLPQPPGGPLTDLQKVIYASLDFDLSVLSPKNSGRPGSSSGGSKKEELAPRHNVIDRIGIVVPSGWDSLGKIRVLSETFSPEGLLDGWQVDLSSSVFPVPKPSSSESESVKHQASTEVSNTCREQPVEVFETSPSSPTPASPLLEDRPISPSKLTKSALDPYKLRILDPTAHKKPPPPTIEVTTVPEQTFLANMRAQLQKLEAQDADRARKNPDTIHPPAAPGSTRGGATLPGGQQSGALIDLGDVTYNVGGVSYNAEAAISSLREASALEKQVAASTGEPSTVMPRSLTPRPPKRPTAGGKSGAETPGSGKVNDMKYEDLGDYFASLMKKTGAVSRDPTPSKQPPADADT